jgi:hypothetical protein
MDYINGFVVGVCVCVCVCAVKCREINIFIKMNGKWISDKYPAHYLVWNNMYDDLNQLLQNKKVSDFFILRGYFNTWLSWLTVEIREVCAAD